MHSISVKPSLRITLYIILVVSIVILGCGTIHSVTFTNPNPANLMIGIDIHDGYDQVGMSAITVSFDDATNPGFAIVQGATIFCNAIVLHLKDQQYEGNVPTLAPPGVYSITYRTSNSSIVVSVPALQAVIVTPSDGSINPVSTAKGTLAATVRVTGESFGITNVNLIATDANSHKFSTPDSPYDPNNPEPSKLNINVTSFTSPHVKITSQGSFSGNLQTGFEEAGLFYTFQGQSVSVTLQ